MNLRKLMMALLVFELFAFSATPAPVWSNPGMDHGIYGDLLKKYVKDGKVNYAGFKSEAARLDRYLTALEKVDVDSLPRNEQFAFYINAYNAWTIKLILTKYPGIKSIKELGFFNTGPWKKNVVRLKGERVSLDHIEHDILRPRFNDPRVHFAINCAAKSCPPFDRNPIWQKL